MMTDYDSFIRRPCSTRQKSRTDIQYSTFTIDHMISFDACPHRQFYTIPVPIYTVGLQCQAPTLIPACQTGERFVQLFYDGLWFDPLGRKHKTYCMRDGNTNH